MFSAIGPGIIGIVCIIVGVYNMRGNISSIHWYHRHRISQENIIPFGKLTGLGTIISGVSIVVFSMFLILHELTKLESLLIVGALTVVIGLVFGMVICIYAIIKYNKGLF